jgi:hypothetical protein
MHADKVPPCFTMALGRHQARTISHAASRGYSLSQPAQTGTVPFFAASKLAFTCAGRNSSHALCPGCVLCKLLAFIEPPTCSQFTTDHQAEMYSGLLFWYLVHSSMQHVKRSVHTTGQHDKPCLAAQKMRSCPGRLTSDSKPAQNNRSRLRVCRRRSNTVCTR